MKTEKEKKSSTTAVVSREQAISEVRKFVYFHDDLQVGKLDEDEDLEEKYPHIVSALMRGLLVIDEKQNPIFTPTTEIEGLDVINFRTRIKPMDNAAITKGLDLSKNTGEFILRCISFLSQQPKGVVNALNKYDYKVVEQISTLFL